MLAVLDKKNSIEGKDVGSASPPLLEFPTKPKEDKPEPPQSLHQSLENFSNNQFVRSTVSILSNLAVAGQLISAVANFGENKFSARTVDWADKSALALTKIFQIVNSVKNISSLVPKRDYLASLGHAYDFFIGLFAPMKNFFFLRGLPVGTYTGALAANTMNEKANFASLEEHLSHLSTALSKSIKHFSKGGPITVVKRFFETKPAMTGVLAFVFGNAGVMLWKPLEYILGEVMGRKIATSIRNFGGFMQDIEYIKPGHLASGRKFFYLAGVTTMVGVVANWLGETFMPQHKKAFDPLSLAFSGIGRAALRESYDREEIAYPNKPLVNIKKVLFEDYKPELAMAA